MLINSQSFRNPWESVPTIEVEIEFADANSHNDLLYVEIGAVDDRTASIRLTMQEARKVRDYLNKIL